MVTSPDSETRSAGAKRYQSSSIRSTNLLSIYHLSDLLGRILTSTSVEAVSKRNGRGQLNTANISPRGGIESIRVFEAAKMFPSLSETSTVRSIFETPSRERFSIQASKRGGRSRENEVLLTLILGEVLALFSQSRLSSCNSSVARVGTLPEVI